MAVTSIIERHSPAGNDKGEMMKGQPKKLTEKVYRKKTEKDHHDRLGLLASTWRRNTQGQGNETYMKNSNLVIPTAALLQAEETNMEV